MKPKQQLHELMVEMFLMLENLNINENDYLQFGELFKQMNINIDNLVNMKTELIQNTYYRNYIKNTVRRHRLTENEKLKNENYIVCNCGRCVHKNELQQHFKSQVHYQGRRNRKYAKTKLDDEIINMCISREVVLQAFIINHLKRVSNLRIDDNMQDEVVR